MTPVLAHAESEVDSRDLRPETQGLITFYHSASTPGYWFPAGELEAMIDSRFILRLDPPTDGLSTAEEFERGPVQCPRCGAGSKLFDMRSYMSSEVRMKACHVCHGRWIGRQSLDLLFQHVQYSGFIGSLKRLFSRNAAVRHA